MAILISDVRLEIDDSDAEILRKIRKILRWRGDGPAWRWQRRSLDARKRSEPHFVANFIVDAKWEERYAKNPHIKEYKEPERQKIPPVAGRKTRPIIVGSGPAGLFAAWRLTEAGLPPLVLERGDPLAERCHKVSLFRRGGPFDPESNVPFGQGGAGTFSDGKLLSRIKDPRSAEVFEILHQMGAREEILWQQKAHVGTDELIPILDQLCRYLEEKGAIFQYRTRFEWLDTEALPPDERADGFTRRLRSIRANGEDLACDHLILALGHSARDTLRALEACGLHLEAKGFAAGFRIEHLQKIINIAQLGDASPHPRIGAADYRLHTPAGRRSIYSFCMCPGGDVIAAASEERTCVTNGMSSYARAKENANAGILCGLVPSDFGEGLWGGMEFQECIEKEAFSLGGSNYKAPVQRLGDFVEALIDRYPDDAEAFFRREGVSMASLTKGAGRPEASYLPGVHPADLSGLYPKEMTLSIAAGILHFGSQLRGFSDREALLTAPETRSSSPVRVNRNPRSGEACGIHGIFPCGEGAGYAGGITSSAVDGLLAAEHLLESCR